ncbi:fumarylacetoacetate hydrolase family protein [Brevibacillus sp. Leaf182]|uniref:fumarylacetoacetate hydrolase family protein n=1 Tax=Brevibacillus sp. Leaf182 TaxID=1736290 RepID=UPI0006F30A22|nr:fumarylacetoacetate hydrolase family protein [Brevibacillus sp. Leaf182]RAT96656.1 FAA hydrolase family protein [Brevibacillus sp. Leaf182]
MGIPVVRFEKEMQVHWGVVEKDEIVVLAGHYRTLADFLKTGVEEAKKALKTADASRISFPEITLKSPVTEPARIICQGANYVSHRAEAGLSVERPPFNMIFTKADSSLCGADSDIMRPKHVKLLDYELELGLVLGQDISGPLQISDENLHEYVAGLVIANDVSARDVQLPQGQWLKGKSYRTFCPTGPYLYLLEKDEMPSIHELDLKLWVNGELRQSSNTSQLLYKPAETLTELSEIMNLSVGDLILTGTTGGVALHLQSEVMDQILNPFVPGQKKMELLVESQMGSNKYLRDGDIIRCEIKSADGSIDLGIQENQVRAQQP